MAGILKETGAVKDYWLEPDSRSLAPKTLALTDSRGRPLEEIPYEPGASPEVSTSDGAPEGLLIDFGKEVGGHLHLKFASCGCGRVGAQPLESIRQVTSPMLVSPLSKFDFSTKYARLNPGPGEEVHLPHFGGFRYLWLYPERPGGFKVDEVRLDYTPHLPVDVDKCGYFLSSDDLLNRAWFAGLHTIEMCTVDPALGADGKSRIGEGSWVLIDGAKRDRLIWTGDLDPMAEAIYVSDFNTGAVRDSLLSLARYQKRNGYIPGCSPAPGIGRLVSGLFGEYVAWWVVVLYRYYLHTGDLDTLKELFPAAKRAIAYLESQCRDGLFRQTPRNMQEWCFTVIRLGKPTHTNAVYYWALGGASFLARVLGQDGLAAEYTERALSLGKAVERELWDEGRGAFVDTTVDRRRVPQDGNSIAIVSGLVKEREKAAGILDYLKRNLWESWGSDNVDVPYYRLIPGFPWHNKRVMPFMNYYEALARFTCGDDDGAMELIRRCWGNMVEQEPGTTFWEWTGTKGQVDARFCSLCHGWSGGVVPLLSRHVLGIRTEGVAYSTFNFDPHPAGLEWVEGRVPVNGGFIEARVEKKKDGYDVKINAPKGMEPAS